MNNLPQNEQEWRERLTDEQYKVLRQKGTEPPFSGKSVDYKQDGRYRCAACGNTLFTSNTKFDSKSGWPSFDRLADNDAVELEPDPGPWGERTEVICARCKSHLGHVFDDGPTKTGKRYCINSIALDFEEDPLD